MFLGMDGGWLDALFTYLRLLFGFLYGLWLPSVDIVTSRKLTDIFIYIYIYMYIYIYKERERERKKNRERERATKEVDRDRDRQRERQRERLKR